VNTKVPNCSSHSLLGLHPVMCEVQFDKTAIYFVTGALTFISGNQFPAGHQNLFHFKECRGHQTMNWLVRKSFFDTTNILFHPKKITVVVVVTFLRVSSSPLFPLFPFFRIARSEIGLFSLHIHTLTKNIDTIEINR